VGNGLEEDTKLSNESRYQQRLSTFAANWRALALRGLVALLFGLVVLFWPGLVLTVLALLFGLYAAVDGVITFVPALRSPDRGAQRSLPLAEGAVGIIAGLVALLWPGLTPSGLVYVSGVGDGNRYAQDTDRDTAACRGGKRVATGRKRRPVGNLRRTPRSPGQVRGAISGALYRGLRCGGWLGLDRIRLPIAGAETMTYGEPLPTRVPASAALPSNRGYPLGDTCPWGMTSHRAGAYAPEASCRAGANKRKTGPKGRCDESPPRRQRGRPDRRPAQSSPRCS
jgi:hypothetical protein